MAEPGALPSCDDAPLLTPRVLVGLSVCALAQASVSVACVWPGYALLSAEWLPAALSATALALALLLAPAWSADPLTRCEGSARILGRNAFLCLWQATALAFFLLIAARVVPLQGSTILRSALILGATIWLALATARRWPRAYLGLALFWTVALPMSAFILAEVFISTPAGSAGWSRATAPGANAFRETIDWALRFSPATALVGALQGRLPGDAACGWREAGWYAAVMILGGLLFWRGTTGPQLLKEAGGRA